MELTPRFNSMEAEAKFWRERYNLFRQEVADVTQQYDAQLDHNMATIEDITVQLTAARKHAEGLNAALQRERKDRKMAKRNVRYLRRRLHEVEETNGLLCYCIKKYKELNRSLGRSISPANGQEQEQGSQEQGSQEQGSQEQGSQEQGSQEQGSQENDSQGDSRESDGNSLQGHDEPGAGVPGGTQPGP